MIQCVTINRRISLFGQIPCASCVIVYRDDFEVNYILFGEFVAILILIKYIKSEIYFVEHDI